MPDYKLKDGTIISVKDEHVDIFLSKNKGAVLIKEVVDTAVVPGKNTGPTADAGGPKNTASKSDDGSSVPPPWESPYAADQVGFVEESNKALNYNLSQKYKGGPGIDDDIDGKKGTKRLIKSFDEDGGELYRNIPSAQVNKVAMNESLKKAGSAYENIITAMSVISDEDAKNRALETWIGNVKNRPHNVEATYEEYKLQNMAGSSLFAKDNAVIQESISFSTARNRADYDGRFDNVGGGGTIGYYKQMPLEEVMGETKFAQYTEYLATGDTSFLTPDLLFAAKNQLKDETAKRMLMNVPENLQDLLNTSTPLDNKRASQLLKLNYQFIKNYDNKSKTINENYKKNTSGLINQMSAIDSELKSMKTTSASPLDEINKYNKLIEDRKGIAIKWNSMKFEDVFKNLVARGEILQGHLDSFSRKTENVNDRRILEGAAALNYTFGARTTQALEEFFIGGAVNFAAILAEGALKGLDNMTPAGSEPIISYAIDYISKSNQNYNKKLSDKREANIPAQLKLDEIGKDGVTYANWFSQAFAENSGSMITTFIPGAAQLRGAMLIKNATKGMLLAKNAKNLQKAYKTQQALSQAAMRTAQAQFFVSETGSKYGQMQEDDLRSTKSLPILEKQLEKATDLQERKILIDQIEDAKLKSDYSFTQKAFTAFAFGGAATLGETFSSLRYIQDARRIASKIGLNEFKKEAYQGLRFHINTGFNVIKKTAPMTAFGVSSEVIEEGLVLTAHNVLDIYGLGQDKSITEGLDLDFIANIAVSSGGMQASGVANNIVNIVKSEFKTKKRVEETRKLETELINLNENILKLNEARPIGLTSFSMQSDTASKEIVLRALQTKQKELMQKLALDDGMALMDLNYMSPNQIIEGADIKRRVREYKKQLEGLGRSGDLSSQTIKIKEKYQDLIDNLSNEFEALLDPKKNKKTIKADKEKTEKDFAGVKYRGGESDYARGLADFYKQVTLTSMDIDDDYLEITPENIDNYGPGGLSERFTKEEIESIKEDFGFNTEKRGFGTFTRGKQMGADTILMNVNAQQFSIDNADSFVDAKYAAITSLEELFHLRIRKTNLIDNNDLNEAASKSVDEVLEVIAGFLETGRIKKKEYDNFVARLGLYKTDGEGPIVLEGGKRNKKNKVIYEEVLAQINNLVALGLISRDDIKNVPSLRSFINGLGAELFGTNSWMLNINNSDDVFRFITNFQDNSRRGQSIGGAVDDDEENVSRSSKSVQELETELDTLNEDESEYDVFDYQARKQNLEFKIKRARTSEKKKPASKVSVIEDSAEKIFKEPSVVSEANLKIADINEEVTDEMISLNANRLSDIKDDSIRQRLATKLAKNNEGSVRELAKKSARVGKDLNIDENDKVTEQDFISGYNEELAALINTYKVKTEDGKKVPFGAYMKNPLRLRYGAILKKEIAGKIEKSSSLSNEKTREVAESIGDATSLSSIESTKAKKDVKLINVKTTKSVVDKNIKGAIDNAVDLKGVDLESLNYKDTAEKFMDSMAQALLGISGSKASGKVTVTSVGAGKVDNGAVTAMQGLFKDFSESKRFIRTLPEFNVSTNEATVNIQGESVNVSKDKKGIAVGLNKKIKELLYENYIDPSNAKVKALKEDLKTETNKEIIREKKEEIKKLTASSMTNPSGRSKGESTQPGVVRLKPEYRGVLKDAVVNDFMAKIGLTPSGESRIPVSGKARSEFGTVLQGATKIYLSNLINTVAREQIAKKDINYEESLEKSQEEVRLSSKTNQILANVGAGKSRSMASKSVSMPDFLSVLGKEGTTAYNNLLELTVSRDKNRVGSLLNFDTPTINAETRPAIIEELRKIFTNSEYGLTLNTFFGAVMQNGGRLDVYGEYVDGVFIEAKNRKKAKKENIQNWYVLADNKYIKRPRPKKINRDEYESVDDYNKEVKRVRAAELKESKRILAEYAGKFTPKVGNVYYGKTDPNYIDLVENATKSPAKYPKAKKINIPKGNNKIDKKWKTAAAEKEASNKIARREFIKELDKAYKEGKRLGRERETMSMIGSIVIQSYQATSGLIKITAPFKYVSDVLAYGEGKNSSDFGDNMYIEEHSPPASVAGASVLWAIKNDFSTEIIEALDNNFSQTMLSKFDDSNLNRSKLDATLPVGITIFNNPAIRYSDALIDLNSIKDVFTGVSMGESNGVAVDSKIAGTPDLLSKQKELIQKQSEDKLFTVSKSQKEMDQFVKIAPSKNRASKSNNFNLPGIIKYSKPISVQEGIDAMAKSDKALDNARRINQPVKKIRVFDFDDTLARTKSNVLYTMPGENVAYNASPKTFDQLGKRTGLIFLATDIKEAQEYAKSNRGEVRTILVNDSSLATEDQVLDQMNSLNIDTSEGLLYEMIDSRFEDFYIGNANLNKLKKALKQNGFGGFKYNDGSQISSKGTESIAVIDKSIINEPNKINAAEFAERSEALTREGAQFDFSEFSKIMDGKKGPLFEVAKIIADKRGTDDVFVLTARPANAAGPIQEFLKSIGLNIPLNNITGLGNGDPQAKAGWVVGKAAEGYNDFYFADDATGNVKAVKNALAVLDVKSKVQQAYVRNNKSLDFEFNQIIENKTGIAAEKNYAKVKARVVGKNKGRFDIFIPPSAEDFVGLLYKTLGKGEIGDSQMKWYKENLLDPYARAVESITRDRNTLGRNFKALKQELNVVPKDLKKKFAGSEFTKEQGIRVYIWDQIGKDIPGLSKADLKELTDIVKNDAELELFAQEVMKLNKGTEYVTPNDTWITGTITTDLAETLNTTKRKQYLEQWQQNADIIFSEKNLNKMEAAYGRSYRDAMENILARMKTGTNRTFGGDTLTGRFTDWLNGSTAAIMFFNSKSAVLQTISNLNFINFGDNNILAAGRAFANQPQYWSDFKNLFNSDFLVDRRDGLKINVNEADIADVAKENGVRGVINKLLKLGFTPTQLADSFAIASGGATFYRNRIKSLMKEQAVDKELTKKNRKITYGDKYTIEQAEKIAMRDFREKAEESQQSSRPDRISSQQAGPLGRIVLAFANTPAQYARLIKKAASDLKNGRGDAKSNISKIMYYGVAQNLLFNALQQALFSIAFGDEEEALEEGDKITNKKRKDEKTINIINGMADSLLRGTGIGGAIFSVVKNTAIKIHKESKKKNPKYETAALELLKISPPVSSKVSKIMSAGRSFSWNMDEMKSTGFSLDNPAWLALGNTISAATNIPLDRVVKKLQHLKSASDAELETYKRMALLGGWSEWELGIEKTKKIKVKEKVIKSLTPYVRGGNK